MYSPIILAGAILSTLTSALVGLHRKINNTPQLGLNSVTFPLTIAGVEHKTGYSFSQQFGFAGTNDAGIIGIQNRPDSDGSSTVGTQFSTYIAGATTSDPNCTNGEEGIFCSVELSGSYADTYLLEVNNTILTTWQGTIMNSATGQRTQIGEFTLPSPIGLILFSFTGQIEYIPWLSGQSMCSGLPDTSVSFGSPTTNTSGAGLGEMLNAYEFGDCVGKIAFSQR